MAEVGFALLSRVQHDHGRVKSYFLKSYSLVLVMTIPITICAWGFAPERRFRVSMMFAPVMIAGYLIGLHNSAAARDPA